MEIYFRSGLAIGFSGNKNLFQNLLYSDKNQEVEEVAEVIELQLLQLFTTFTILTIFTISYLVIFKRPNRLYK